jgi:hypothetical protein
MVFARNLCRRVFVLQEKKLRVVLSVAFALGKEAGGKKR